MVNIKISKITPKTDQNWPFMSGVAKKENIKNFK